MTTSISPSVSSKSDVRRSRRAGWSGLTFVVLLVLTGAMASVPGGSDSVRTVREFYGAHAGVVVVGQLVGLVAAAVFAVHARALAEVLPTSEPRLLRAAGMIVAAASGLTAVPVLVLTTAVDRCSDRVVAGLARASDLTDVLLFAAVALFAAAVARASYRSRVAVLAGSVALLSAARSGLLASGSSALHVAAPLGFLALVAVVSISTLVVASRNNRSS